MVFGDCGLRLVGIGVELLTALAYVFCDLGKAVLGLSDLLAGAVIDNQGMDFLV